MTYILGQLTMWWIFHTSTLFWKLVFPLHAQSMLGKIKYIHITCVILGFLLPLVPIISSMAKFAMDPSNTFGNSSNPRSRSDSFISGGLGFGPTRFPTVVCSSSDPDVIFYSLIVPIDIVLACGCTMLIIIFWSLYKVSIYFIWYLLNSSTIMMDT